MVPDLQVTQSGAGDFDFTTPGRAGSMQRIALVMQRSGSISANLVLFNRVTGRDTVWLSPSGLRGTVILSLPGGTPFRLQTLSGPGTGRLTLRTVQVLP